MTRTPPKKPRHYTDEQIEAVLLPELRAHNTEAHYCIRVRHIAWEVMGITAKTRNKPSMTTQLAECIRILAARHGWYPDKTDTTIDRNLRLYKGGKP